MFDKEGETAILYILSVPKHTVFVLGFPQAYGVVVLYLAFDKREAVAGGRGSGRTRAFWWSGFGFSRRGRSFPVEWVLLTDPLK